MSDQNNNNTSNRDIGNVVSDSSTIVNKSINSIIDSGNQFNKWYADKIKEITDAEVPDSRLETNMNSDSEEEVKIETKVEGYSKIQTNSQNTNQEKPATNSKLQTNINKKDANTKNVTENTQDANQEQTEVATKDNKKQGKLPKRIETLLKGAKTINNMANKAIRTGNTINTSMSSSTGSYKSFEHSANRQFSKPVKKLTNALLKPVKQKAATTVASITKKMMELVMKLIMSFVKFIISMLPQLMPAVLILIMVIAFVSFFGMNMSDETRDNYETYMIDTQNEYDKITIQAFQEGIVVEGAIDGKGMINWRAPMSIMQMLGAELVYDNAERTLLDKFKNADLLEKIEEVTYTYEKELDEIDSDGNKKKETVTETETKKVVTIATLDDYINWCNNNFSAINDYKKAKKLQYDSNQKVFTESEIEEIKLLYSSTAFFDLFSDRFRETYAYGNVIIDDEKLQKIYDEFLKNAGKRYLMDHSNLDYDNCMEYYDCSSLVLHILGHTGIAKFPNCGATGLYTAHCNPIPTDVRQPGDLIFLKDTYDTRNTRTEFLTLVFTWES